MELRNLKKDMRELVVNGMDIYQALECKNRCYSKEGMVSLSLYASVLRLGEEILVLEKDYRRMSPGAGYPYANKEQMIGRDVRVQYQEYCYMYQNIVGQILNNHGISLKGVLELLGLDVKYMRLVRYKGNENMKYDRIYRDLFDKILNYYLESAKILDNCSYPSKVLDIPSVISALHYPNIDPLMSILSLYQKLSSKDEPTYLDEIEDYVTYEEEMGDINKEGELRLYRVSKKIKMNKNVGRII